MAATPTMRAYAEATLGAGMLPEGLLSDPTDNVRAALDGIEAGEIEILADTMAIEAKAALAGAPARSTRSTGCRESTLRGSIAAVESVQSF